MTLANPAVIGASDTVRWTNNGGFNRNVTIELSTDGGTTFPLALASDVANTGSFTFTVPNLPTSCARIRVREHNFIDPLGASANFAITAQAAAFDVSGKVLSLGGSGVPFAEVLVFDTGDNIIRVSSTNAFGDYLIQGLPSGQYTFVASKKRFRFSPQALSLSANVTNLNFISSN